ncbi:acetylcholine receptor subunit beta-type acr-3-like [Belonocnema kinseyi]|uniref:acetylcholine receptor subunit beta-type acr-3-like n=1 Tax=Belonocnema kinseyi TaxID=2817044 RepID=UPI00143E0B67|nr:acetylcholine receptor subunit beta-type acr-3-like [Belonocnema kinseyi]
MWIQKIIILTLFSSIAYAISERDRLLTDCKENTVQSKEKKLRSYLFDNYDVSSPPCANKTTIEVTIYPKSIEFNEISNTLELHSKTITEWNDDRLLWDVEKFNVSDIGIHAFEDVIWIPEISVHTSADFSLEQKPSSTHCLLFSTGYVGCKSSIVYTVRCHTEYTTWPYDVQYCELQLGSWTEDNAELNFTSRWTNWMWRSYVPNPQWDIVYNHSGLKNIKNKYESDELSYMIWMQIVLKRHSGIMEAIYVTPAITLMSLTLMALWMECNSFERLIIVCINFICHLLCILNLHWSLPNNGQATPLILLFYENSLMLAGFTLLLTVILCKLQKLNKEAPKFLTSAATYVLKSRIGQVFLVNILDPKVYMGLNEIEDDAILTTPAKKKQTWKYVSILIGWISFTGVLIIYFVMLINNIPRDSSYYNSDLFEIVFRNKKDIFTNSL